MLSQDDLNQLKKVLLLTSGFWTSQVPPDNDLYLASLELEKQGFIVRGETYQSNIFFSFHKTFPQSLF